MNGILNLYKPSGITSHTAVSIVKRVFGVKKVGHTGTLDPMASGVLPILVGSAVKLSEYMICDGKKYRTRYRITAEGRGIYEALRAYVVHVVAECGRGITPEERAIFYR